MNKWRSRHAIITCCLLLTTLLGACADANPTPTPIPPLSAAASPTSAPGPGGGQVVDTTATYEPGPCTFQQWLVHETTCGTLSVLEDHQQPGGRRIKLAVAILKSTADHPAPDPVVFLQGGPGISVLTNKPELNIPYFYALLASRDVILLEQRGIGLSEPSLDCPEVDMSRPTKATAGLHRPRPLPARRPRLPRPPHRSRHHPGQLHHRPKRG